MSQAFAMFLTLGVLPVVVLLSPVVIIGLFVVNMRVWKKSYLTWILVATGVGVYSLIKWMLF